MTPESRARILRLSAWLVGLGVVAFALPVVVCTVSPPGCASCHTARGLIADVTSEAHFVTGVSCVDCHIGSAIEDRIRFGVYQAYGMAVPILDTAESSALAIADSSCRSCHDDIDGTMTVAGLRIKHDECASGSSCVDCHSDAAHTEGVSWPTVYDMDTCLGCHDAAAAYDACDTCHVGSLERVRRTTGAWAVTHGSDWQRTHGMGEMTTCRACHAESYCTRCHGPGVPHDERFFGRHGALSLSADARCTECHEQALCDDCHGLEMPHPIEFTRGHADLVDGTDDASCKACHADADCVTCHVKHVHPGGAVQLGPDGRTRP